MGKISFFLKQVLPRRRIHKCCKSAPGSCDVNKGAGQYIPVYCPARMFEP